MRFFAEQAEVIEDKLSAGKTSAAASYTLGAVAPDDLLPGEVMGDALAVRHVTRQEAAVELLPQTQFVVVVRDPVWRAVSQYLAMRRGGRSASPPTPADFHALVTKGLEVMSFCRSPPSCLCYWNAPVRVKGGMLDGRSNLSPLPLPGHAL